MDQRARRGAFRGAWPLLALLAAIVAALAVPQTGTGAASAPAEDDKGWTTIRLVYHSDSDGFIEPCG